MSLTSTIMIHLIVLALTLNIVAGSDELIVTARCRDDITLHCNFHKDCENYTSVGWYKVWDNSSETSIRMTTLINYNDSVPMEKNISLVLRKVVPTDSGTYMCLIKAKTGGKNCQKCVRLNISDCVSTVSPIFFDTSTNFTNESHANNSAPLPSVNDDSVLLVLWGCGVLAVSKLVLSAISIWVFRELSKLKSQQT